MKQLTLFVVLFALVGGLCGCSSYYARSYEYRYRAGTTYEYNQLMEAYDADSGDPPPLPPASNEPGEGEWVRVPVRSEPVFYDDYYYTSRRASAYNDPYYDSYYYDNWYYPRTYMGGSYGYRSRRSSRRSGISVGFGFGHGGPFRHGGHFGHYGPFGHWP